MDTGDFCHEPMMQPLPLLSTTTYALDYNMTHPNRGICLILNQEQFQKNRNSTFNLSDRKGSKLDAEACTQVFTKLGFDVLEHRDLSTSAVRQVLKKLASLDHSQFDCFACVVLTHGDHGHLYASDGRYPIDLLFNNFLGNNCPSLVGKPKLFFIQACQGSRLDPGVLVEAYDAAHYFKIPTYADFLIAYSTIPGFYSWRNTEKGSWFIAALAEVLREAHMSFDLLTMMTLVSHKVAYCFSSNAASPEQAGMKQVPCITSMLTRRVFFSPKKAYAIQ